MSKMQQSEATAPIPSVSDAPKPDRVLPCLACVELRMQLKRVMAQLDNAHKRIKELGSKVGPSDKPISNPTKNSTGRFDQKTYNREYQRRRRAAAKLRDGASGVSGASGDLPTCRACGQNHFGPCLAAAE